MCVPLIYMSCLHTSIVHVQRLSVRESKYIKCYGNAQNTRAFSVLLKTFKYSQLQNVAGQFKKCQVDADVKIRGIYILYKSEENYRKNGVSLEKTAGDDSIENVCKNC